MTSLSLSHKQRTDSNNLSRLTFDYWRILAFRYKSSEQCKSRSIPQIIGLDERDNTRIELLLYERWNSTLSRLRLVSIQNNKIFLGISTMTFVIDSTRRFP